VNAQEVSSIEGRFVLDHGYVQFIESWGSDERIIEAARMSTNKGFLGWGETCAECGWSTGEDHDVGCSRPDKWKSGDEKLLRFLYENKHATPFEMAGMVIEVKAPIFVFREWHRHRTQSYNEMSARYIPLPDENYIPSVERLMMVNQQTSNKQAQGGSLTETNAIAFRTELLAAYNNCQWLYDRAIQAGVAKELARLPIPVARYSKMRASANLRNWLGFLTLRMASNAQWEIREYANAVGDLIKSNFPRTWELFVEGKPL
jgi:thymidylate synthase (FAD)